MPSSEGWTWAGRSASMGLIHIPEKLALLLAEGLSSQTPHRATWVSFWHGFLHTGFLHTEWSKRTQGKPSFWNYSQSLPSWVDGYTGQSYSVWEGTGTRGMNTKSWRSLGAFLDMVTIIFYLVLSLSPSYKSSSRSTWVISFELHWYPQFRGGIFLLVLFYSFLPSHLCNIFLLLNSDSHITPPVLFSILYSHLGYLFFKLNI